MPAKCSVGRGGTPADKRFKRLIVYSTAANNLSQIGAIQNRHTDEKIPSGAGNGLSGDI